MRYLPVHIDLQDADILVIGGGAMAEAKIRTLLATPARLYIIAKTISENIKNWANEDKLIWQERSFTPADLTNKRVVYVASGHQATDRDIAKLARQHGLLVNAADDKIGSNFFSPAIIDRTPVSISVGTEGHSPGMARLVKAEIEAILPANLGDITRSLGLVREGLAKHRPTFAGRLAFWKTMFKGQSLTSLCALSTDGIARKAARHLAGEILEAPTEAAEPQGRVTLVGGGPGNPDLLTRQAARQLGAADVIVYDRLISQAVLDVGRREAEYIYVGKEPGGAATSQEVINALLVTKARDGHHVVRLKGGDPLMFGRADEELAALEQAGIAFDICPGITAASASAAAIFRSLTTRGVNTSLTLLSGHDAKGYAKHDWAKLAQPAARAVIYMGLGASTTIRAHLQAHGARPDTPMTIVENASLPTQKITCSSLDMLTRDIKRGDITGPAILMLGYGARSSKTPLKPKRKIREQEYEHKKTQGKRSASHNGQQPTQRQSRVPEPEFSLDQSSFQGFG